jgi:SMC interacting uncharacterized protein involved in chromosome segregation
MNDSADIKMAADRLQTALRSLEGALDPLLAKVSRLEASAKEAETMGEDRAALAAKLDDAKSNADEFAAREKEFGALADETTRELDRVIKQVRNALGEE